MTAAEKPVIEVHMLGEFSITINGNTITVYYDKHWSACEKENAIYILRTTFEQAPDTLSGRILVSGPLKSPDAKGEVIFTLPFRQHISRSMTKEH